ncbi:MAG: DUF167 domain-containing protein [Thermoguttaceae bacterium]|jgi:uncharacterized protein (TIGR00251 family)
MKEEGGRIKEGLELESHKDGTLLAVRAQAGARRNAIAGLHGGMLKISVTQAPEKGKANKAIAELLAERLGVPRRQIELLSGGTSSRKRFLIRGLTPAELQTRIAAAIGQRPSGE